MKAHTPALVLCVALVALGLPVASEASPPAPAILQMSLTELRASLDKGALSSADLVAAYLAEIEKNNHRNLGLGAVMAANPDALRQARAWDARHALTPGQASPALAGIPFLAKDNYNTAGIATTGGSLALATSIPARNAFVVQKLLDQGAVLLGKTNLSELAASYGWYGYSSTGGQTVNPFNPLRSTDGSSSGSAAAVAARFAPFALGTDTTASIRAPASVTGTVGMRTTLGAVGRSGIIPMSLTADVAGVVTRTVADQAVVLDAIRGPDPDDAATAASPLADTPLAAGLGTSSLAGRRIAVIDNFDGAAPDVDAVKAEAVALMEKAGAQIVHLRLPKRYENLQAEVLGPIGLAEFKPEFEAYLAALGPGQPKNMADFMAILAQRTGQGSQTINPGRYKGLVENLETTTTDSPEYIRLLTVGIPDLRQELGGILATGHYDALFFPTMGCTAPVLPGKTDPTFVCKAYSYAAAKISSATGFPEISVNAGRGQGNMPVGVSFLGNAGQDHRVLELAAAFERLRN